MATTLQCVDLFCGAGGSTTGIQQAANDLGVDLDVTAINHWTIAIDTHSSNHAKAKHYCAQIESLHPREVVPGGKLKLLWASPSCTHHSRARGGKPTSDQQRAGARYVIDWAEEIYIENIIVENVIEFEKWGVVNNNPDSRNFGRPIKSKEGEFFYSWVRDLERLDYRVEWRRLNAADYGEATTRERLFIQARKKWTCKTITWPEPTHKRPGSDEQVTMFGDNRKPWRPAREIIDWSLQSKSIFDRKKKLSHSTLKRIYAGLERQLKYGRPVQPFLVVLRNHMDGKPIDQPLPTITAGGGHMALCEPFVTTAGGATGQGRNPHGVDKPLGTILTNDRRALVEPIIIQASHGESGGRRDRSLNEPLPTVTGSNDFAVVEPFLTPTNHGGQDQRTHDVDRPMPAITTVDAMGLTEALICKFYGTGVTKSTDEPLDTITTKDRFGLVSIDGHQYKLDIRFRMLQPHELAAAMGFPKNYKFAGNREQKVKQIGNAVSSRVGRALAMEVLQSSAPKSLTTKRELVA